MICTPANKTKFKSLAKATFAEFIATTLFVYTGCGSVYASGGDKLTIALAFGLSITALAYTVGHVSGGHMNPIVSIAMIVLGQIDVLTAAMYIVAQCLGAMVASSLLSVGFISHSVSLVVNQVNDKTITTGGAFIMEVVLSFLLVYVIAETAVNKQGGAGNCAPIAIGVAVFMAHIVAIPFTGCSINPARSFGPAIISGTFNDLWLFVVAPITGAVLAALTARFVFGVLEETTKFVDNDSGSKLPYDRLCTPGTDNKRTLSKQQSCDITLQPSSSRDLEFPVSMSCLDEEAAAP